MTEPPAITFGLIVLNGEPFIRYNLRAIYPFAHEIIVVEGASPAARASATPHGHSTDSTLETLQNFKAREDPENKLIVVTAEDEGHPDGFWPGEKNEQSQAYAKRATGNYLWQVDVDEFYLSEAYEKVRRLLSDDPEITAISVPQITFWGDTDVRCDGFYLRRYDSRLRFNASEIHRVFKWGPGFQYATHRPPTVLTADGRDVRSLKWLRARQAAALNLYMHHYSLLFPRQVREKAAYYSQAEWSPDDRFSAWAEDCYLRLGRPFRVHNVCQFVSWLKRFDGETPEQIANMMRDIDSGEPAVERRPMADVRRLLDRRSYRLATRLLELYTDYVYSPFGALYRRLSAIGFRRHFQRWRKSATPKRDGP